MNAATVILYFLQRVVLLLCLLALVFVSTAVADDIKAGGTSYWMPYCYTSPEKPDTLQGFTVDLLQYIFRDGNPGLMLSPFPWKRCLKMLDRGELELVLDGSSNSRRIEKFIFSDVIYKLDNVFFYSKMKYPSGPKLQSVQDVSRYSLGGVYGFNYSMYPFDTSRMQTGAPDIKALLEKIRLQRFDLGLGYKQVILSYVKRNNLDLDQIGWVPIPGMESLNFHIMARKTPEGQDLINKINTGIQEMKSSGLYRKLLKKYGLHDAHIH